MDRPPHVLPETAAHLEARVGDITALVDGIFSVCAELQVHPPIAMSAMATVLVDLVREVPAAGDDFTRKTLALRGVAEALQAYCGAPSHAAGCVALGAAVAVANQRVFHLLDDQIATTVRPRG